VIFAAVLYLVIRFGREAILTWGVFSAVLLQPVLAGGILVFFLPGRRRFTLPLAAAGTGLGLAAAAGFLLRNPDHLLLLMGTIASQVLVAIPAFVAGLILWWRGEPRDDARIPWGMARTSFAAALGAGCLLFAGPFAGMALQSDVDRAQRFVEALAAEIRREEISTGCPPERGLELLSRLGPQPPFLEGKRRLSLGAKDGSLTITFEKSTFMGVEGWVYQDPPGAWSHWVD
jgi:hypothetical protein